MSNPVARALGAVPRETALVVALVSGSHVVNHMYLVLLPPLVGVLTVEYGVGVGAIGVAMGAVGVTNTTFQLPFGYLSDEHSRTWTLGLALGFGALGAGVIALAPTFEWLVVGQLVLGVGVAGHHPAHFPLLSDATPARHRGRAFSVHGFAGSLGFAAPPAMVAATFAVPWASWRHVVGLVAVVGAAYGVLAVVVLSRRVNREVTRPPDAGATAASTSLGERVVAQLRAAVSSRIVVALALLALVTSIASWGVTAYAVVLLTDSYGVATGTANLALTGMFVAGAFAILLGGELTDRVAPGPVILATYAVVTLLVVAVASTVVPPALAVAGVVLVGAFRAASGPARSKLADDVSARGDLGQNFAVITIGIMLGSALAPPAFGAVVERVGAAVAFYAIAAVCLAATLLVVAILWTYRTEIDGATAASASDD